MVKFILSQIKQYKKSTILSAFFTILEVVMELITPLLMAIVIDEGIQSSNLNNIYKYIFIMLIAAIIAVILGVLSSKYAADASSGVACILREGMYKNIQTFSFSNIDKYSTAGLITRLTTDVTNFQNAYQMIIRMCVKAPITLICAFAMVIFINAKISFIFFIAMIFLSIVIGLIIYKTLPLFSKVFEKYDNLNTDIQENISAIRVVKSYTRENYEKEKFNKSAYIIYKLFVKAESILALNSPTMMTSMYALIIAISWFGAKFIVLGTSTTGELTSLFTYISNILMSLMLLSMIFVMVSMSYASTKRIYEVLKEKTDIENPKNPIYEIENGDITFENVYFSYKKNNKYTLSNINLKIKQGQTIGIVGST